MAFVELTSVRGAHMITGVSVAKHSISLGAQASKCLDCVAGDRVTLHLDKDGAWAGVKKADNNQIDGLKLYRIGRSTTLFFCAHRLWRIVPPPQKRYRVDYQMQADMLVFPLTHLKNEGYGCIQDKQERRQSPQKGDRR